MLVRGAERWDTARGRSLAARPTRPNTRRRRSTRRASSSWGRRSTDGASSRSPPGSKAILVLVRSARRTGAVGVDRRPLRVEGPRRRSRRRRAARGARGAGSVVGRRRDRAPLALRGPGAPIGEDAIGACVARVRTADTWALVDAVGARDLGRALRTLADAYDPRERGLPLLGALAWSIRQLARYQAAVESGASGDEAARRAGVFQPYRARELATKARAVPAQGGRALAARPGRDRPGPQELAPQRRRDPRRDAHPALPGRNARQRPGHRTEAERERLTSVAQAGAARHLTERRLVPTFGTQMVRVAEPATPRKSGN